MAQCKRCNSDDVVKRGFVRHKQRYQCKEYDYHFVSGDGRVKASLPVKKALVVILYSLGKASFGMLGKLFDRSRSLTYRWIVAHGELLPGWSAIAMLQPSAGSMIK